MVLEYKIHSATKHLKIHPRTLKSVIPEKPHWKIVPIPSCRTNKAPRNSSEHRCDSRSYAGSANTIPLLQFLPFWHGINFQRTYSVTVPPVSLELYTTVHSRVSLLKYKSVHIILL